MSDWIGLGIIVLVLAGGLFGLARLGKGPEVISQREYERRVREGRGTMSAGVMASMHVLQKLMNPKAAEAVEVQKDLEAGFYNDCYGQSGEGGGQQLDGEGDEPAARRKDLELSAEEDDEEEDDA